MGAVNPRQLIVNVDEDHELACEDVTWGYEPDFVVTYNSQLGMMEVKTKVPMTDGEVVATLYQILNKAMEQGTFTDEEKDATSRGVLPEVPERTEPSE
jgi:hypothetical protein